MLTATDFDKKQIIVVLCQDGERLSLHNSNLVVKNKDETVKLQCTCYRVFLVFLVGHCSITTALLQAAKRFGFFFALMTTGFRMYGMVGAEKDGNYLLHQKQYAYEGVDIAKHIIANKIANQLQELKRVRNLSEASRDATIKMDGYIKQIDEVGSLSELMAYEGLASKLYFKNHFNMVPWQGRQPRIKRDYVNAALDIGYMILFSFIDALLSAYGFDTYCGVMHRQFYMRKSLVCDLVEPFRPLVDHALKTGINRKQVQESHFELENGQWRLKWKESANYVRLFLQPILSQKAEIFEYVQAYYRAFMKGNPASDYPVYTLYEDSR